MTQADLDLLGDFVSDRITADAFPRLQALLQASAPARRALRGLSLVEETLGEIAVERYFTLQPAEKRPAASVAKPSELASRAGWMPSPFTRGLLKYVVAPVAIVAVAALVLFVDERQRQVALRPAFPVGAIAQIVALSDVAWQPDAAIHHEADGLQKGASLGLARGIVEIMFACGATVVLEGPATFGITDAGAGTLSRGQLVATLENHTGPFSIQTPSAVVIDRGTQFGVEVDAAGKTEVRVFAGLVELASLATLGTVAPLQLVAGNAGEVAPTGAVSKIDAPAPKKFALTVPRPATKPSRALPFRWDAAAAETLYRDSFADDGPLAGSLPTSRGEGQAAWIAPKEGWQFDAPSKSLKVSSTGAAFLPFAPEPGHLYRLSVTMHVVEGGIGWGAIGFSTSANTRLSTLDHAWMLQRHETKAQPNAAYAGPQTAGELRGSDRLTGAQVRTIVLDTTRPRWKAYFLAGDDLVGECEFAPPQKPITGVGISVFPNTVAVFHNFSLQANRLVR
jgi:hypothetical protein